MNYTKGEWEISEVTVSDGYSGAIKHAYIFPKDGIWKGRTVADVGYWRDFSEAEVKANAHLIAASPRMADLLQRLVDNGWNASISDEAREILQMM